MASVMCSLIYKANQLKEVSQVYSTYSASVPHIQIELGRARAQLMNLPVSEVFATLRTHLGSQDVNDFNILGRDYRVKVQDDSPFRDQPNRIDQHYIRSSGGGLVPLRTLVHDARASARQSLQSVPFRNDQRYSAAGCWFRAGDRRYAALGLGGTSRQGIASNGRPSLCKRNK
jgi:multidrug efflux pump subunit AcrB